jgi:hypothetical protein
MTYPTSADATARKQLADAFRAGAARSQFNMDKPFTGTSEGFEETEAHSLKDIFKQLEDGTPMGKAFFNKTVRLAAENGKTFEQLLKNAAHPKPPRLLL